jgi:hypothetical protein
MVPVAANVGDGAGDPGLDPLFQLLWSRRHNPKPSEPDPSLYLLKHDHA